MKPTVKLTPLKLSNWSRQGLVSNIFPKSGLSAASGRGLARGKHAGPVQHAAAARGWRGLTGVCLAKYTSSTQSPIAVFFTWEKSISSMSLWCFNVECRGGRIQRSNLRLLWTRHKYSPFYSLSPWSIFATFNIFQITMSMSTMPFFSANLIHSEVVFSHCFSLISTGSSVLLQLVMVKFLPGHVSFLTRLRQCDLLYGMYGERQLVVF